MTITQEFQALIYRTEKAKERLLESLERLMRKPPANRLEQICPEIRTEGQEIRREIRWIELRLFVTTVARSVQHPLLAGELWSLWLSRSRYRMQKTSATD